MRLTDADAYKEFHRRECPGCCCTCTACAEDMTCKLIDEAPTVEDAVIVTRCKDCKYGDYDSTPNGAMVCLRTNDGFWRMETDFCSYGERREGGNDNVSD